MTAEELAQKVLDTLAAAGFDVPYEPDEDMRTGGYFFSVVDADGDFDVLVVKTP